MMDFVGIFFGCLLMGYALAMIFNMAKAIYAGVLPAEYIITYSIITILAIVLSICFFVFGSVFK